MSSVSVAPGKSTKERLLAAASKQFAMKGFYGASLADIAKELGMTKQTLLHHFQSKEKLYAAVLEEIALNYKNRVREVVSEVSDPLECLEAIMIDRLESQMNDREDAQIVMRELLDNQDRAQEVDRWYLRPWLDGLVDVVLRIPTATQMTKADAFALIYQLLGAISYLGMSEATLSNMLGTSNYKKVIHSYPEQLKELIRHRFPT